MKKYKENDLYLTKNGLKRKCFHGYIYRNSYPFRIVDCVIMQANHDTGPEISIKIHDYKNKPYMFFNIQKYFV